MRSLGSLGVSRLVLTECPRRGPYAGIMPRSNRPRGRRGDDSGDEPGDLSRALLGLRTTEHRRDGEWNVQSLTGESSAKPYTCPGCGLEISTGTPHLVAWRADGVLGDAHDLGARRHWHTHCWRIRP